MQKKGLKVEGDEIVSLLEDYYSETDVFERVQEEVSEEPDDEVVIEKEEVYQVSPIKKPHLAVELATKDKFRSTREIIEETIREHLDEDGPLSGQVEVLRTSQMSGLHDSEQMAELFSELPGIEDPLELESKIVDLQFSISMLEEQISSRRAENARALV